MLPILQTEILEKSETTLSTLFPLLPCLNSSLVLTLYLILQYFSDPSAAVQPHCHCYNPSCLYPHPWMAVKTSPLDHLPPSKLFSSQQPASSSFAPKLGVTLALPVLPQIHDVYHLGGHTCAVSSTWSAFPTLA